MLALLKLQYLGVFLHLLLSPFCLNVDSIKVPNLGYQDNTRLAHVWSKLLFQITNYLVSTHHANCI